MVDILRDKSKKADIWRVLTKRVREADHPAINNFVELHVIKFVMQKSPERKKDLANSLKNRHYEKVSTILHEEIIKYENELEVYISEQISEVIDEVDLA